MPVLPMYFIYSLLLALGFLILLPRFLFDAFNHGKYVAGFRERLGLLTPLKTAGRPVIWIHCVSVGETLAARPLVQGLKQRLPQYSLAISTTTLTGQNIAREVFREDVARVFYFPFDWRWIVRRTLTAIKPAAVLIMETELWPGFLRECQSRRIPVAIVNGRLSENSFRRYRIISGFMSRVLNCLSAAFVQTEADEKRLVALGMDPAKLFVTGNMKFDANSPSSIDETLSAEFRDRFKFDEASPLIVAASTHAPEEQILLDALKRVASASGSKPRMLIAPRHPERFNEVADLIKSSGFRWTRRTAGPGPDDCLCEVILLDSIGELPAVYSLASVVFVGGSLAKTGGHNILEPAAVGAAVITGANTFNFKQIVETFAQAGALIQLPPLASASDAADELANVVKNLLDNPDEAAGMGRRAVKLVSQNRGATGRTLDGLTAILLQAAKS
ncbi:MAG TPA: 3-deoxy-D-manno-octulosonic acid transferase [Pyrinomonadaceae bacterium]|nr:3-deoxy-D-manno-octulosonic acid transferase [Pyrinomonadaceae bacterium]